MQDDALALIKNELKVFDPVRQLMTVSLVSPKPEIERIKGDADNVRLWYAVDVKVDEAKQKTFQCHRCGTEMSCGI